ncbi:coiled-coil domain-containing protein 42 homolog [Myripristis murdjan]|uniref:coiled-coil domain-containing protein 42 homolog n=1 Tax=Myripristis murdjan TaxID=586833 RepID=UPI001175E064|nr:cilia- and flagella-associated protein 73 [Myripristis murdjan]
MTMNLEDDFRTTHEEQVLIKLPEGERDLMTGATQMLEKRREIIEVDKQLEAHREDSELKRKSLRQRRDEVLKREDKLKESLLNFDKFLKENEAKRSRGARKAENERRVALQKEAEIERLKAEIAALEEKKQKLQRRVERNSLYWNFLKQVLKTAKFEEVWELLGRVETLLINREQLQQRASEIQEQTDSQRGALQTYMDQQSCVLLQKNNLLSQLQTQLDQTCSEVLRWESKWAHIQSTAAKETLLLGQIKMVTLNLYQMTDGEIEGEEGVTVDDTETQLDKIQIFIQNHTDVMNDIKPPPSETSLD